MTGEQQQQTPWSLSAEEREATVQRIAKNISSIAFFKGLDISDADAKAAAVAAEKKAYTAAQVAARTTTGNRPHAETTSGYARCVQTISNPQREDLTQRWPTSWVLLLQEARGAGAGSSDRGWQGPGRRWSRSRGRQQRKLYMSAFLLACVHAGQPTAAPDPAGSLCAGRVAAMCCTPVSAVLLLTRC